MHSQLKRIQSNCSQQLDVLQRFRQDLEQVTLSVQNTSSQISTVRQSVATAPVILRLPNEITQLRKVLVSLSAVSPASFQFFVLCSFFIEKSEFVEMSKLFLISVCMLVG